MEKNFRFIAMLAACFVIYLFLASCNRHQNFTGKTGQVLNGPINISAYDVTDQSLTLKDNNGNNAYSVTVKRNTKVNWNLTAATQKEIVIQAIKSDPRFPCNDSNFFSMAPAGSSDHWQATIGNPSPGSGIIEKYYIEWKLISTGKTYTFDPLLQLNP